MLKILLIGCEGQLGWELQRSLLPLGAVTAVDYPQIDLTSPENSRQWIRKSKPDVVINAAAYTDVDGAETETALAFQINGTAPGLLAEEAREIGAVLVHFSTDYVFEGSKAELHTETDPPNPINAYGESKLAGEKAVQQAGGRYFIFRTSWLYSLRRKCFLTKVLAWAREKEELRIVTDQVSGPTWSRTLADTTAAWLAQLSSQAPASQQDLAGVYHLGGNGAVSRYQWAQQILRLDPDRDQHRVTSLSPADSSEFETPARRPAFSALDCSLFQRTFNLFHADWLTCLAVALTTRYAE